MSTILREATTPDGLTDAAIRDVLEQALSGTARPLRRVLLIPPDDTRLHSYSGRITAMLYRMLAPTCHVDILPALGTHRAMSQEACAAFYGPDIPFDRFLTHNWRSDVVRIGTIPGSAVANLSDGLMNEDIEVEVNRRIMDPEYDRVVSIGQVVPHEVAGMAGYSKNLFVGCGGPDMISKSHLLGAFYGMERIMGRDHSPVRKLFDYAEEQFLCSIPLLHVLTVTTAKGSDVTVRGLFAGRERSLFEQAVSCSRKHNLTLLPKPLRQVVVLLDENEFRSTWIGNKAIYRTRMALADGGNLLVLAPGVDCFGEDPENDRLIRKYGYAGRDRIRELYPDCPDLQQNQSVPAHLIHGSSDGRFSVTYAVKHLSREEVEGVGYRYMPYEDAIRTYDPNRLRDGFNNVGGTDIYYISNPALGLWSVSD